jgi:ankyrin repeat/BTB/POZ domain-containing protein 1
VSTKRGTKIRHVQIESKQSQTDLQEDLAILAMLTLPYEFQFRWHYWMELPMKPKAPGCDQFADIIFKVQSHLFHCHRAMFCTRSNYFQALINDHFNEGSWDDNLQIPVIEIHNIDASVFAVIVNHVYSNMQNISPENVYDIMEMSDMFFLPDLKRQVGSYFTKFIAIDNVVDLLQTARLFNVPKLEHQCIEFMANYIEEIINDEKFKKLVISDAENVKARQETDSIDIIDELRFVLRTTNLDSLASIQEAENRLSSLNTFLEDLGFQV